MVGWTAGSLEAESGPRFFFFLPTRVGRGGSHFFFCSSFFWFWSPGLWPPGPPDAPGSPDGVLP